MSGQVSLRRLTSCMMWISKTKAARGLAGGWRNASIYPERLRGDGDDHVHLAHGFVAVKNRNSRSPTKKDEV